MLPAAWAGAWNVTNGSLKAEGHSELRAGTRPTRQGLSGSPDAQGRRCSHCLFADARLRRRGPRPTVSQRRGTQASDPSLCSASCLLPPGLSRGSFFCLEYLPPRVALGALHPLLRPDGCWWAGPALAPLPPALAVLWDSGLGSHTCWVIQRAQDKTTGTSGGSGLRAALAFNYPNASGPTCQGSALGVTVKKTDQMLLEGDRQEVASL